MNPLLNAMMPQQNNVAQTVSGIMNMVRGKDPNAVVNMMMQKNPQFAQFVRENQGLSEEQIAAKYGFDYGMIRQMMG